MKVKEVRKHAWALEKILGGTDEVVHIGLVRHLINDIIMMFVYGYFYKQYMYIAVLSGMKTEAVDR